MNSAHTINDDDAGAPGTGAHIVPPGRWPVKRKTACAEVLADLLDGIILTGMDAVFGVGTTRLAAHIGYLEGIYEWRFARRERVIACSDGRTATIMTYRLDPSTILLADALGAVAWCAQVRAARAALRNGAGSVTRAKRRGAVTAHDATDLTGVT